MVGAARCTAPRNYMAKNVGWLTFDVAEVRRALADAKMLSWGEVIPTFGSRSLSSGVDRSNGRMPSESPSYQSIVWT